MEGVSVCDGDNRRTVDSTVVSFCSRSVGFLKHWPVQQLGQHPQDCMFHYFNRGQVLVRDSNNSDWIYIVKSGSLSVMKKLQHVDASDDEIPDAKSTWNGTYLPLLQNAKRKRKGRTKPDSPEVFRNSMEADRRLEQTLPGAFNLKERLGLVDYDRIISDYRSRVQSKLGSEPQPLTLPQLPGTGARGLSAPEPKDSAMEDSVRERVRSDPAEAEIEEEQEGNWSDERESEHWEKTENVGKNCKGVNTDAVSPSKRPPYRRADLDNVRRSSQESTNSEEKTERSSFSGSDQSRTEVLSSLNIAYQRKFKEHVGRKTMADQLDYKGSRDFRYAEVDFDPMFVLAQVLERGQYFGVSQLIYPDQPSLSLVSNGAELVVVSKKLFLDHASELCIRHLRRTECPFPAQDVLQNNLQDYVNWEAHRARVYRRLVTNVRQRQARRKQFLPNMPPGRYSFRSGAF